MKRRYYYLLILLLVFIIPSCIAGYFVLPAISKVQLSAFVVLITIVGSIWDLWSTRHGKRDPIWIWMFNRKDTLGVFFLGLPIEEYLFYPFSSVYVIFIWKAIELAGTNGGWTYYLLIPALGIWTLASVLFAGRFSPKSDKVFG